MTSSFLIPGIFLLCLSTTVSLKCMKLSTTWSLVCPLARSSSPATNKMRMDLVWSGGSGALLHGCHGEGGFGVDDL